MKSIYRRSWRKTAAIAVIMCFLVMGVPSSAFSQNRNNDQARNELALILGGRLNGYAVSENDKGEFFVDIQGATNPADNKKLDGTFDFAYRCANVATVIVVAVIIARGRAREKVRCMVEQNPFIYY